MVESPQSASEKLIRAHPIRDTRILDQLRDKTEGSFVLMVVYKPADSPFRSLNIMSGSRSESRTKWEARADAGDS